MTFVFGREFNECGVGIIDDRDWFTFGDCYCCNYCYYYEYINYYCIYSAILLFDCNFFGL